VLVDAVFARTRGNAYLTTLLARGLPPDATSLPAGLPTALREAVANAWHGLSSPARELTRLLAVAGRPQPADQLAVVARITGVGGEIVALLREAADGGVVDVDTDGRYWFTHPLLAEVLEEGLLPEERRARHAAFAALLDPGSAEDVDVERAAALADHHYQAGNTDQAYRWALIGADAAGAMGGLTEMVRLLRRALDLHAEVPDAAGTRFELLQNLRTACERAGDPVEELAAIDEMLALVEREQQPLLATELMVRRMLLREETGRDFASLADATEAVQVSARHPGSAEHALAVAVLASAEVWHAMPSSRARAEEAVDLATACASTKALTYALTARVMAQFGVAGGGSGLADAERAQAAAAQVHDYWAFTYATMHAHDTTECVPSRRVVEYLRRSREHLTSLGAPHLYIAKLSALEAHGLLTLGEWRACVERLRVVLGSTPGPAPDTQARLASARLACWQGRWSEAQAHLTRAEELFAELPRNRGYAFAAVRAELALATGDTRRAMAVALAGVEADGFLLPIEVERLIPLAARAAADEVQTLRDRGEDLAAAIARLLDLKRRYPAVVAEEQVGPMYAAQVCAMQTLYEAELLRGQLDTGAAEAWMSAAHACADAELRWDEAYAQWRAAQNLLADRSTRDEAVTALRRAHELAVDLEAAPLQADVEALARSGAVALDTASQLPATATLLPGLTPREREVLAHAVAGRTYRQIAREMQISEKTVSVHMSNLFRKTRTSNRIELAQLVRRLAGPTPE
jgi:DNA-binding CsgD family transcriptional regulator